MAKVRRATHAGSWYTDNGGELNDQLGHWLADASASHAPARAIIAPHAGYYYCGACGAYAYKQINPAHVKKVFILGPSHHVHLTSIALSPVELYKTPLYDLPIDTNVYRHLQSTGMFQTMSVEADEDEHSIEMQLPYIAKVMESRRGQFTVVPMMVGSLSLEKEQAFGKVLAPYLADPNNLFVISSDFCHWGQRFRYTHYDNSRGDIWQSIEHLDRMGMEKIEAMDHVAFNEYLKQFHNTICGRHPIGVLLAAITVLKETGNGHQYSLKFTRYAQSTKCRSMKDSSVSYASAAFVVK